MFLLCWSVSPCCGREGRLIVLTESWGSTLQSWLLPGRLPPHGCTLRQPVDQRGNSSLHGHFQPPPPLCGSDSRKAINNTGPVLFCLFIGSQKSCHHTYCVVTGYSIFILLWLIVKMQSKGFYLVLNQSSIEMFFYRTWMNGMKWEHENIWDFTLVCVAHLWISHTEKKLRYPFWLFDCNLILPSIYVMHLLRLYKTCFVLWKPATVHQKCRGSIRLLF